MMDPKIAQPDYWKDLSSRMKTGEIMHGFLSVFLLLLSGIGGTCAVFLQHGWIGGFSAILFLMSAQNWYYKSICRDIHFFSANISKAMDLMISVDPTGYTDTKDWTTVKKPTVVS